jgi:hypothetical protein
MPGADRTYRTLNDAVSDVLDVRPKYWPVVEQPVDAARYVR